MKINNKNQVGSQSTLKGKMKVSNDIGVKDKFTQSDDKSAIGDFFHDVGDHIKYMFLKDGTPEKEGAYVPDKDGKYEWCDHPDPKDFDSKKGSFCLKIEACASDVFYWRPYTDPQNEDGPYGMGGYIPKEGDTWGFDYIEKPSPKDFATGGEWYLDTACGGHSWYWHADKPAK